ncbi:MAG: hypothetical protein ACXAEU_16605 [Candidatus Hodarchaeales archaeon]
MDNHRKKLVFEIGTRNSRIGFAGEEKPRFVFPTVVGTLKGLAVSPDSKDQLEYFVGKEAWENRENLELSYPIEFGHIRDWKAIEKVWAYSFKKLGVDPTEHPVLLIEPTHSDLLENEKIIKLMFERFKVTAIYFSTREVLSMYGSIGDSFIVDIDAENLREAILGQKATGLVVDIGFDRTYVVPVYQAFLVGYGIKILDFGGRDISIYLNDLLEEKGCSIAYPEDLEILHDIRKKFCYVALDPGKEAFQGKEDQKRDDLYELPNGKIIDLGKERFLASEILFNPILIGIAQMPIDWMISYSIYSCDENLREELYGNILLTGECSLMLGLRERLVNQLEDKLEQLLERPELNEAMIMKYMETAIELVNSPSSEPKFPKNFAIKINPIRDPHLAWIGGSYISSLKAFEKVWITKEDYAAKGPKVVRTLQFRYRRSES